MDPTCHACGSPAHVKVECPHLGKVCDLCGKVGHLQYKCRLAQGGGGGGGFQGSYQGGFGGGFQDNSGCHACGGNHLKAECPNISKVCDVCGKVGHLKAKCRMAAQPYSGGFIGGGFASQGYAAQDGGCHACGGNHFKAECPNLGKECDVCGKVGHLKAKCRAAQGAGGAPGGMGGYGGARGGYQGGSGPRQAAGDKLCDNCQNTGHLARDCPNPAQCHCCGSTEHSKKDCSHLADVCGHCTKPGHHQIKCRAFYLQQ